MKTFIVSKNAAHEPSSMYMEKAEDLATLLGGIFDNGKETDESLDDYVYRLEAEDNGAANIDGDFYMIWDVKAKKCVFGGNE
jgi:hypothetical protein